MNLNFKKSYPQFVDYMWKTRAKKKKIQIIKKEKNSKKNILKGNQRKIDEI